MSGRTKRHHSSRHIETYMSSPVKQEVRSHRHLAAEPHYFSKLAKTTADLSVLLIGSTGNGKSCLGNFLLDPDDDHLLKKQTFSVAKDAIPHTDVVKCETKTVQYSGECCDLTIIDTPGLNENDSADLRHMIGIVENLKKAKTIHACIFVVKFESKIDAQYKSTLRYYIKLLPHLFEKNVILVLTDYACDERAINQRERRGIDVDRMIREYTHTIEECAGLHYEPPVFKIDCLPYGKEERMISEEERDTILQYLSSLPPFEVSMLRIAKTDYILQEDLKVIKGIEGEVSGYNERLQQQKEQFAETFKNIETVENKVTHVMRDIKKINETLTDLDSDEKIVVKTWSFTKEWKLFKAHAEKFTAHSLFDCEVDKWDNGKCTWDPFVVSRSDDLTTVDGILTGKFMRGVYASLSFKIMKKRKNVVKILEHQLKIRDLEDAKRSLETELKKIKDKNDGCKNEIANLSDKIDKSRNRSKELDSEWMSIDKAKERFV